MLTCDCGAIAKMTKTEMGALDAHWTYHNIECKSCKRKQSADYVYERNAVIAWNIETSHRMKKNLAALDKRVNNAKG